MNDRDQQVYRFSEAPIWELQRAYFEEQGIEAWQREEVPQYITSNPVIATAYAEMIFGFLQDRAAQDRASEKVTIVELGAGSGQLAFHVLKELSALIAFAELALPPFRYVMTDLPAKNISFWQQHRSLMPFVEQGLLDFAQLDATKDSELHLTESGEKINAGQLGQPLLLIANYFFDSIPQELIYVDEGLIYECRVSLSMEEGEGQLDTVGMLGRMVPEYHYCRAAEYEQDNYPYREAIALYREKLEDSHILFPIAGLECLERLGQLSRAGFVLLTADKGDHRIENWAFAEPPKLIHHGSFSLTANYHAIQHTFELKGARTHFTEHHYKNLNVGFILMVNQPDGYIQTRLAYRRYVDRFGPDDFFSLKLWFDAHLDTLELSQILAFWRLGRFDPQLFLQSAGRIEDLLEDSGEEEAEDLRQGMVAMWQRYYPLDERQDLALICAMLLYRLELYEAAGDFYEKSLASHEGTAETLYGMAICCYELEREAEALLYAERALRLDPLHEGAAALLAHSE
ncbi:tetratricopeptide (TPR) repeat protein [Paenibacillus endophyticus]|uniref:Tetratricopeptide (TPR) repeat protein n=1 Tax=Paenibacillus endophyticus TaxID=1294268 RepID=A0A7W5C9I0_9BACL|nr:SAM-dependent methyltransferase [Paenibacillus endophyticus]MBB3153487.1 tetratricopeptide (TPR) repeat protein [Paenibacillus endophyticus]